jgi:hypothetical protein
MNLTRHETVLSFAGRRTASDMSYQDLERRFAQYQGRLVRFSDESGQVGMGKIVDLLPEGVFVVETKDGQQHDVSPKEILWRELGPY